MLEASLRKDNAFIGLSYDAEHLPLMLTAQSTGARDQIGTLVPKDAQDWLKRLRSRIAPIKMRFYLVGEYGDQTFRPHYHAALFGFQTCHRGRTLRYKNRPMASRCCSQCKLVFDTWGKGDVDLGNLETKSAQYLAGYVTKKMTRTDDPRLEGRWPEFARMSNRPGVGQPFLWDVASAILDLELSEADVPSALRHGKKILPLGRYMKNQLRKMLGKEEGLPDEIRQEISEKMLTVLQIAKGSHTSLRQQIVEAFAQDVRNIKAKSKIYSKRGSL